MFPFRTVAFFVAALFLAPAGWPQAATDPSDAAAASAGSPVAFVYVSRPTHIDGFAVSSSGKLTPVPGSPFANIAASSLSVNKSFSSPRATTTAIFTPFPLRPMARSNRSARSTYRNTLMIASPSDPCRSTTPAPPSTFR